MMTAAIYARRSTRQNTGDDKWSIPDRKIAMKYLIAVKGGMDPRQWAALHPVEWKRLVEIAPLRRRGPGSVEGVQSS
jgi:hypothetical protein